MLDVLKHLFANVYSLGKHNRRMCKTVARYVVTLIWKGQDKRDNISNPNVLINRLVIVVVVPVGEALCHHRQDYTRHLIHYPLERWINILAKVEHCCILTSLVHLIGRSRVPGDDPWSSVYTPFFIAYRFMHRDVNKPTHMSKWCISTHAQGYIGNTLNGVSDYLYETGYGRLRAKVG